MADEPAPDETVDLLDDQLLTEAERVIGNRLLRMLSAGFDLYTSEALARDKDVDVHVVEQLLEKGATHVEVCRIVL